jgi:hypothetical protein
MLVRLRTMISLVHSVGWRNGRGLETCNGWGGRDNKETKDASTATDLTFVLFLLKLATRIPDQIHPRYPHFKLPQNHQNSWDRLHKSGEIQLHSMRKIIIKCPAPQSQRRLMRDTTAPILAVAYEATRTNEEVLVVSRRSA